MRAAGRYGAGPIGLVILVVLGACAADPEPKFANPTSQAPTITSDTTGLSGSSTLTEPTYPRRARGGGQGAAEAFIGYYFELTDYAAGAGDLAALRSLAAPECRACESGAGYIRDVYAAGGHVDGLTHEVRPVSAAQFGTTRGAGWIIAVDVETSGHVVVGADGVRRYRPGDREEVELTVTRTGPDTSPWRVSDYRTGPPRG